MLVCVYARSDLARSKHKLKNARIAHTINDVQMNASATNFRRAFPLWPLIITDPVPPAPSPIIIMSYVRPINLCHRKIGVILS